MQISLQSRNTLVKLMYQGQGNMILFGQARLSTCSIIIIYNAKDDGWFSWSPILPSTSALDFELAAILLQSCHVFLLDSAHKHDTCAQTVTAIVVSERFIGSELV